MIELRHYVGNLISNNPLYDLFYGTFVIVLITAGLLLIAAFVAFARNHRRTGLGLLAGVVTASFGVYDLTGPDSFRTWITPITSALALVVLVTVMCIVAWRRYSVAFKVITINALMLLTAVDVAMGSESFGYKNAYMGISSYAVDDAAWFAILVLSISLAVVLVIFALVYMLTTWFIQPLFTFITGRTTPRANNRRHGMSKMKTSDRYNKFTDEIYRKRDTGSGDGITFGGDSAVRALAIAKAGQQASA